MSDLIERGKAMDVLDYFQSLKEDCVSNAYAVSRQWMDAIPSAEPSWADALAELHERFNALEKEIRKASAEMSAIIREYVDRPKGEWIDMGDFEQCSVCKGTHLKEFQTYYGKATWIKTDFCPSCGADMRGERSGTDKDKFEQ